VYQCFYKTRLKQYFKKYGSKLGNLPLGTKLVIAYILIIFIPTSIFSVYTFSRFQQRSIEDIVRKNNNIMEIERKNIIDNIQAMENTAQRILGDRKFKDYIRSHEARTTEELIEFNLDTIPNINKIQYNNPKIANLTFYTGNSTVLEAFPYVLNEERIKDKPWFDQVISLKGSPLWEINYTDYDGNNRLFDRVVNAEERMALFMEVQYPINSHLGIIQVDMYAKDFFAKMYGEVQDNESQIIIIDKNEKVYTGGSQELIEKTGMSLEFIKEAFLKSKESGQDYFQFEFKNKPMIVVYKHIPHVDCYMLDIISLESTFSSISRMRNILILGSVGLLVMLTIVTYFINSLILKKLHLIIQSMKKIQQGDFSLELEVRGEDEIGELAHHFRKMLRKINELIAEAVNKRAYTKEAELRALHTQIDSHFMYNVLENIKMAAEIEGQYFIADYLTSLGEMMRYNMKWRSEYVALRDEIGHIKNYTALMNLRYSNRIQLKVDIDSSLMDQEVLKMSLQPVVENAVKHGIKENLEDGMKDICISAYVESGRIFIEIMDNGAGMTDEELADLNKRITITDEQVKAMDFQQKGEYRTKSGGHGIGLKNVNLRIKLFYGAEYGIKVFSEQGLYTKVQLLLPAMVSNGGVTYHA
jgi:two-component system, sensor histidine kinase YesM